MEMLVKSLYVLKEGVDMSLERRDENPIIFWVLIEQGDIRETGTSTQTGKWGGCIEWYCVQINGSNQGDALKVHIL
ncbi:unnamed protein product [Gongylonema pulchrum]|uniref:DOC domain-containing protein n=1 Tax=Gongylonema pulchrum TaxID=637853 RepID=A0A183EJ82_9BILA|nr:unnamed protein product [Gongylonema pulchrum]